MMGCACHLGHRELQRWVREKGVFWGILPIPIFLPFVCPVEQNTRANINTSLHQHCNLQLESVPHSNLTKVRGFVCLPPLIIPLVRKWEQCRLITESFPPQLCWASGCPVGLPNPCRTLAQTTERKLQLSALQPTTNQQRPRETGSPGAP